MYRVNVKVEKVRTCRCGHEREHYLVSPEEKHSIFGLFLLLLGATATPLRVEFRCRKCEQVFDSMDGAAYRRVTSP